MAVVALFASAAFAIPPRRPGGRPHKGRPSGQSARGVQVGQEATDFELPVLIERQDDKRVQIILVYIAGSMLGADGKPKKELLAPDGLHLSDEGYKLWTSVTLPLIGKPDKQ